MMPESFTKLKDIELQIQKSLPMIWKMEKETKNKKQTKKRKNSGQKVSPSLNDSPSKMCLFVPSLHWSETGLVTVVTGKITEEASR